MWKVARWAEGSLLIAISQCSPLSDEVLSASMCQSAANIAREKSGGVFEGEVYEAVGLTENISEGSPPRLVIRLSSKRPA
jgi:hypothetical protein